MGIRIFEVNPLSTLPKHFLPSILFGSVILLILFLVWITTSDKNAVRDVLKSLRRHILALIAIQVFLLWKYVSEYQEIYLGY